MVLVLQHWKIRITQSKFATTLVQYITLIEDDLIEQINCPNSNIINDDSEDSCEESSSNFSIDDTKKRF